MKIVIVHYHLRPGGVTGVIRQQVLALHDLMPKVELTVLCGEGNDEFDELPCSVNVVSALNYFVPENRRTAFSQERSIARALLDEITCSETIFHFHNPTLGKNPCLTGAVHTLLDRCVPIVFTCHDFSEDRPVNQMINETYAAWVGCDVNEFLYPDRKNITYLTINSVDRLRSHWSQFQQSSVSVMAPPVQKSEPAEHERGEIACRLSLDPEKEWVFYPVRAIERKNIAEFMLLALLDEGKREWLLARAPQNQQEKPLYNWWLKLAKELKLSVLFDAAERCAFSDLMNAADRVITTSIREGFGMAFLEPWYAGKPVAGRELPMVVEDMRRNGIRQDLLYSEFLVPDENGWSDFGELSSECKTAVLRDASESSELRETIRKRNRWWDKVFEFPSGEVFEQNFNVINQEYSRAAYGLRLKKLYNKIEKNNH